ncbi:MAG: methylated-DNA--[protein]-cysteine S-methyltransferase [Candidatus Binatia bacterium]|nr:methylated-DNA--[protein]-cysteine S-methyltransferase [Candidatus Binatia bacterium]
MRPGHRFETPALVSPNQESGFVLCSVPTNLGRFVLIVDETEHVHLAFWDEQRTIAERHWQRWYQGVPWPKRGRCAPVERAICAYFRGTIDSLHALQASPRGTEFQRRVWALLQKIPTGRPVSYGTLARWVKRPTAQRAVGRAVGSNPVALVLPCHRVIAADGNLGGYAGGVQRKQWLLMHESRHAVQPRG